LSSRSRSARTLGRTDLVTVHDKVAYGVLFVLAFLMPFKFGIINLDVLANPNYGGPAIASLLEPLQPLATELAELLIVLAAFFWLLGMVVTRRLVFRYTTADVFLWAFLGVGLLSSFFSIIPHSAVAAMKEFTCWVLLYHLVVNMRGAERRERALLGALMAGTVCVSLIGLHQWLIGYEQLTQQVYRFLPPDEQARALALLERGRIMATYSSPNSLGGLYALVLPAACLFVLVMRHWTRKYGAAPTIACAFFGPVLAFGVFILTESKGAFISLGIVAVVAALIMHRRLRIAAWKFFVVLALAIGVAAAISTTSPGRKLLERGAHTFEERVGYWRGAARMAADRPLGRTLVGSGFNAFGALFTKYKEPASVVGIARNTHNNYVQLFIEVGVLGLAAFVAFWIVQLARAWPAVRQVAQNTGPLTLGHLIVVAAFFGLLAFLLHSIVDFDLYVPGIAMTAMLFVGLMARHTGRVRQKTVALRTEGHAVIVLAVLMLIAGPLVLFVPMPLTAEIHYFNAHAILTGQALERPADPPAAAIAEMRRALHWDPLNHNYMAYLGGIYAQRGIQRKDVADLHEADAWYTRALKLHPNSPLFIYRRAMVRLDRMRLEGTVEWDPVLAEIERAVAHFPTDPFMRLVYADTLDQAGRPDEAREQFAAAASCDDEAFSNALQTARERYNTDDARAEFNATLERLRAKYGTAGK